MGIPYHLVRCQTLALLLDNFEAEEFFSLFFLTAGKVD